MARGIRRVALFLAFPPYTRRSTLEKEKDIALDSTSLRIETLASFVVHNNANAVASDGMPEEIKFARPRHTGIVCTAYAFRR